jgi:hypothetical protein
VKLVAGERGLKLHRPLAAGHVVGKTASPRSSTRAGQGRAGLF